MAFRDPNHLLPVSKALCALLTGIKDAGEESSETAKVLRKYFRDEVYKMCRDLEDLVAPLVSKAAAEEARRHDLGDLRTLHWDRRPKIKDEGGRSIFHWEHVKPASDLCNELLRLDDPTPGRVALVIQQAEVAWILKSEDDALNAPWNRGAECANNSQGHCRHNRCDTRICYKLARIELLP